MQTIQVVLDDKLLKAANLAAKRQKVNRSELIRHALADHLRRIQLQTMEERERQAYKSHPQRPDEFLVWEEAAAWPED